MARDRVPDRKHSTFLTDDRVVDLLQQGGDIRVRLDIVGVFENDLRMARSCSVN
jgi:hypothetical protein